MKLKSSVAALFTTAFLVSACGDGSGGTQDFSKGDPLSGPGGGGTPSATCVEADLSPNWSADELIEQIRTIGTARGPDGLADQGFGQQVIDHYEIDPAQTSIIDETPAGGQKKFWDEYCKNVDRWDEETQNPAAGMPTRATLALIGGYNQCLGEESSDGVTETSTPGKPPTDLELTLARHLDEKRAIIFKYLCPQISLAPRTSVDRGECKSVVLQGTSGTVSIEEGDVVCDEAVDVIEGSYRQMGEEGGSSVMYEINGATSWICRILGTDSKSAGYDYECESPMGDKLVTWAVDD